MAIQRKRRASILSFLAIFLICEPAAAVRQYTLQHIIFESAKPLTFQTDALRKVIPLKDGRRFDPERLRVGIERLHYVYAEYAFIRMEERHDLITDKRNNSISVVIWIDEGGQFYIRSVTVLGQSRHNLDRELNRLSLVRGKIYNLRLVELFFRNNAPPSLAKIDPQSRIHLDTDEKNTVAVTIDLRPSPGKT